MSDGGPWKERTSSAGRVSMFRCGLGGFLVLISAVACESPPAADGGASSTRRSETGEFDSSLPPRLRALPPFIDGELLCQVEAQSRVAPRTPPTELPILGIKKGPPRSLMFSRASVDRADGTRGPGCSALKPWCFLFGPSREDNENFARSQRKQRELEHTSARIARLTWELARAEEELEAERRIRLAELRKLSGGASSGVYLSNDDSMSLASPQRLFWALDRQMPISADWIRPHELLNYFSFDTAQLGEGETFSVLLSSAPHPVRDGDLTLALSIQGKKVESETRRNANLTYVLDRSESMSRKGRLDLVKRGILRSLSELKQGDIIQIVLFDEHTCALARNFVVGRDPLSRLASLIGGISASGGSNLPDGLRRGYIEVNRLFQPDYSNRVILVTDIQEEPEAEEERLALLSAKNFDTRRVRLSAVGLGPFVNDSFLERVTEAGKGAHVYLSSIQETEVLFGARFPSLIETVATNVHFKLSLPPSLALRAFYGKAASDTKEHLRSVHYFSGTEQMVLANLVQLSTPEAEDRVSLSIEYDDPETAEPASRSFSWPAQRLRADVGTQEIPRNLTKARMVAIFGYQLRYMTQTFPEPLTKLDESRGSLAREERKQSLSAARQHCLKVQGRLDEFSATLDGEPEARRMSSLFRGYCDRFGDSPKLETGEDELLLAWGASRQNHQPDASKRRGAEIPPVLNDYPPILSDY